MVRVGVIDYGLGNLKSIVNALDAVGACPSLVAHSDAMEACALAYSARGGGFRRGHEGRSGAGIG